MPFLWLFVVAVGSGGGGGGVVVVALVVERPLLSTEQNTNIRTNLRTIPSWYWSILLVILVVCNKNKTKIKQSSRIKLNIGHLPNFSFGRGDLTLHTWQLVSTKQHNIFKH